jgi:hypothetical protein
MLPTLGIEGGDPLRLRTGFDLDVNTFVGYELDMIIYNLSLSLSILVLSGSIRR